MKSLLSVLVSCLIAVLMTSCVSAENIRITNTEIKAENIPENGTILAVLYDSAGALSGVRSYKGTETARYAEDMANELPGSKTIKVFVWDMETLRPLGRVYGGALDALPESEATAEPEAKEKTLCMRIGDTAVDTEWESNESVEALKALCENEPLTIEMSMYGGFEQVGSIGTRLPSSDVSITTEPGDIILYSSNQLVVFYGSNQWSYTRLGKITGKSKSDLASLLGKGDVTITLSMESE